MFVYAITKLTTQETQRETQRFTEGLEDKTPEYRGSQQILAHLPQIGDALLKKWGLMQHHFVFNFDAKKNRNANSLIHKCYQEFHPNASERFSVCRFKRTFFDIQHDSCSTLQRAVS